MTFSWEWALAVFVFIFANFFLGIQLLKLFWPLRMLKFTARVRREKMYPKEWMNLVADEKAVRAALPVREATFLIQKGELAEDEGKYRKLWLRSWVYTIATLVLLYIHPNLVGGNEGALGLTMVLCQSLAAYAQGLLVKSLADFRRHRIQKMLEKQDQQKAEAALAAQMAEAVQEAQAAQTSQAEEAAPDQKDPSNDKTA